MFINAYKNGITADCRESIAQTLASHDSEPSIVGRRG